MLEDEAAVVQQTLDIFGRDARKGVWNRVCGRRRLGRRSNLALLSRRLGSAIVEDVVHALDQVRASRCKH